MEVFAIYLEQMSFNRNKAYYRYAFRPGTE